jgi:copper oxidase (laccase) domain-containing protein
MLEAVMRDGIEIITAPELETDSGIIVIFTGRAGGKSRPPFEGLNIAYDVGDEREAVTSNRLLLGKTMGIPPSDWVLCQQVHGSCVRRVGDLERGRGGMDHWSAIPRSDGLTTDRTGLAIGILTADCLPLVLVCSSASVVGAAHVGWRGALYGVAVHVLGRLLEYPDGHPEEVLAFLGPSIGPCCLRV